MTDCWSRCFCCCVSLEYRNAEPHWPPPTRHTSVICQHCWALILPRVSQRDTSHIHTWRRMDDGFTMKMWGCVSLRMLLRERGVGVCVSTAFVQNKLSLSLSLTLSLSRPSPRPPAGVTYWLVNGKSNWSAIRKYILSPSWMGFVHQGPFFNLNFFFFLLYFVCLF